LLLVIPLVALVFRRGIFLSLLLVFLILPVAQPVLAIEQPGNWPDWQSLWKNTNQRAEQSFKQGNTENAAELFNRPDWKAASFYKAQQYEQALEQLENLNATEDHYNRGNTLAKMGRLQQALESYDEVLKQQPRHEDALFNRKLVEDELKKQQQKQQQNQGDQPQQDDQQQQDGEQGEQDQQKTDQQKSDESEQQQNQQQSQSKDSDEQSESTQQPDEKQDQQQQDSEKQKEQQERLKEQAEKEEKAQQQQTDELDETLSEQAEAQWLRRIPDDPGGLLRNKFKYQYGRQQQPSQEKEPW